MAPPISIKLRCNSWKQLAALYKRDLARSAVFLKSSAPPPLETPVRIHLTLPNRELVVLDGVVFQHIPPGGLNGRGPGVDIKLPAIPGPAMAKIQAALENPDEGTAGSAAARGKARPDAAASDRMETAGGDEDSGPADAAEPPGPPDLLGLGIEDAPPARAAEHVELRAPDVRTARPTPPAPSTPAAFFDDDFLGDLGQPTPPAPAEEPAAPSPDEAELVARLEQERESLRKLNAFQILGVGYETTDEAVHEAFASLSQRYHPERFAGDENEAAREVATEIFALIRAAHRLLESSTARERLRKELNRTPRSDDAAGSKPATKEKAAPASPQEEIPTKPVLVAEDGTRVGGDGAGVPAGPQEEIPTKPAVVSADGTVDHAASRGATPPPTPKARPPAPPPIPSRGAAPPPVPKSRPPAPPPIPSAKHAAEDLDEDIIGVDDVIPLDDDIAIAIDLGEDVEPAPAPVASTIATETSAPTRLAFLDDDLGDALDEARGDDRHEDRGDDRREAGAGPLADETATASDLGAAFEAMTAPPVEEIAAPAPPAVDETDFSDAGGDTPAGGQHAAAAPPAVQDVLLIADEPAAAEPTPDVPADHSDLGLADAPRFAEAIELLVANRYNEAATAYRMVRRRDPDDVGARVGTELCEGLKALANRDKLEAAQRFEAVLELDPENRRAASELAEMRKQAAQQRKANLSRLRDQQD
jgi:hypothetical protein